MRYEHALGLDDAAFTVIRDRYRREHGLVVAAVGLDGRVAFGESDLLLGLRGQDVVEHLVGECLRWGEATIASFEPDRMLWAVALMHNSRLLGALIAGCREGEVFAGPDGAPAKDLRRAASALRELAEELNLTNAAYLQARREEYRREQERAYLLHEAKDERTSSIQQAYLREEPHLLSAIRRGERREAVAVLNKLLLVLYRDGTGNLELVKSMAMELVAAMCRAAVEAGGGAEHLLGANYAALAALGRVDDEEALSHWLVSMLNRILDALAAAGRRTVQPAVQAALRYIEEHLDEDLDRDQVAAVIGLSPAHFSRLLKKKAGAGFGELLGRLRIDRACGLLRSTDKSLVAISLEVGFSDQSYFTKVFRRHTGLTPKEWRRRNRT